MISTKGRYSIRILLDLAEHRSGGYRLAREPETCTLWDILQCSEGNLAPVSCLKDGAGLCARSAECRTLPVWEGYYRMTRDYFSGVTLADLMDTPQGDNYVI